MELTWVPCTAKGTLYSYTIVPETKDTAGSSSFVLGLVELEEKVRLFARIEEIDSAEIVLGMKLRAKIIKGSQIFPCFVPC